MIRPVSSTAWPSAFQCPHDALERLGRRRHARNRTRRITAAVLALAITIAGGARVWMTFGSARTQRPITPIVGDTYLRFPATADVRQSDSGVLRIVIRTNLPDGAVAVTSVGYSFGGSVGHARVSSGRIVVTTSNRGCRQIRNGLRSEPMRVRVVVAPIMELAALCRSWPRAFA